MKADKKRVRRHFARAAATYDRQAMLQARVAERLLDMVEAHLEKKPERILEIGCCTGILTSRIVARFPQPRLLHLNDLVEEFASRFDGLGLGERLCFLPGDIETLALPAVYDLIISSSTFHWLHDLPALLHRLGTHLRSGGLLAFAMYGPGNLEEIRALTGRGLSYPDLAEVRALLAADFELLAAGESREILHFDDPAAVLRHLRETGVNALGGAGWSRADLETFLAEYRRRFSSEQGVTLSWHPMYFLARI